ncbi:MULTISPECIES: tail fiber assembly protein [Providencia]|uniref:tail fiber assembly protein n=1 Tax=Providencia TaxID=586 RepID=UPI00234A597F|nr:MULTISPECIES: tail fiber assembly protein [Providencia]MDK7745232.1 tail fiber assembly protein [Providencia rettgeri]MDK7757686.1 tail fiber assembly protein [Providencia rettgeri]
MTDKNYYYSASTNAFYPVAIKQDYIDAGTFPTDAKLVGNAVFDEFSQNKEGKYRIAGRNDEPVWKNIPPKTKDEMVIEAEQIKRLLIAESSAEIAPLQYAVDLNIATAEEVLRLTKLKEYNVLLSRVDTSAALDIEWPSVPDR